MVASLKLRSGLEAPWSLGIVGQMSTGRQGMATHRADRLLMSVLLPAQSRPNAATARVRGSPVRNSCIKTAAACRQRPSRSAVRPCAIIASSCCRAGSRRIDAAKAANTSAGTTSRASATTL
jgi:hypothetical protein